MHCARCEFLNTRYPDCPDIYPVDTNTVFETLDICLDSQDTVCSEIHTVHNAFNSNRISFQKAFFSNSTGCVSHSMHKAVNCKEFHFRNSHVHNALNCTEFHFRKLSEILIPRNSEFSSDPTRIIRDESH